LTDLVIDVLRPDDLLSLRFTFVNLALDTTAGRPPQLVRTQAGQPATIIVELGPQHIAERNFPESPEGELLDLVDAPIPSVMADPTRLAFRVPQSMPSIPLTVKDLLDWIRLQPAVPGNALPDPPGPHGQVLVRAPASDQTAIELPYGLIVSPDASGRWIHAVDPVTHAGRTELWHTRLGTVTDFFDDSRLPTLRAVSPAHLGVDFARLFGPGGFQTTLTEQERSAIADQSANFFLEDAPPPLSATHLMLSQLGAWTSLSGAWDTGEVAGWHHVVCMGRDQYVRVAQRGFLYPFGHRTAQVEITERKFKPMLSGETSAYLATHSYLMVQEPERQYDGRNLPFQNVRIASLLSSEIDAPPGGAFVPTAGGQPFAFSLTATDWESARIDFDAPMVFVPLDEVGDLGRIAEMYGAVNLVDFRLQSIAYVSRGAMGSGLAVFNNPDPALKTSAIRFTHSDSELSPPFLPAMESAHVAIPAVDQLIGSQSADAVMRYHDTYLALGAEAAHGVFAVIDGGLPVRFPAQSVGGFAAPTVGLTGLSVTRGAVPNAKALVRNQFNEMVEGLEGKMLGLIELKDIIGAVTKADDLPTVTTRTPLGRMTADFTWNPALKDPLPGPLQALGRAALEIRGQHIASFDSDPAKTIVHGVLRNVRLSLANVIDVDFASLSFDMETGAKPRFGVKIAGIGFAGDLKFLNDIPSQFPGGRFDGGPGCAVTLMPDGVAAGIAAGLPNISLGALTLSNIACSAAVSLFFFGRPVETRIGLSSRVDPFLVTYSMFGGSGYFALTVKTNGETELEAAIGLAAAAEIDLFVAKGTVQIMAGILFAKTERGSELGGYVRIYGCLEVLQIVTISVDFNITLKYVAPDAVAEASLVVMVRVLGYSQSVRLSIRRTFSPDHLTLSFARAMQEQDWTEYCLAFAPRS
jgi:hypothetical protein